MSFAGASLIRDGKLWPAASAIQDAGAVRGYHLLVVEGYSRAKADVLNGSYIQSRSFRVGGYLWRIHYYPNGSSWVFADYISGALVLAQDVAEPVKAQFRFSFAAEQEEPSRIRAAQVVDFHHKYYPAHFSNLIRRDALENSKHLKDDSFTIRCDVIVIEHVNAKGTGAASPFLTVPPPDMQRHFTDLLMAKEGTDMDAQVFGAMLAFIYSDSEPELGKDDDVDLTWQWQQLLIAADRYDLQRLKLMCEDKLCGLIDVSTTTTILALAERHSCDGLKKACYDFLAAPGNAKTVVATDGFDDLVSSCPSVMKELIVMFAP